MTHRYQLIPKFCAESGYTDKAVRRKIEEGIWVEGREYRRAPDGHIMIDVEGASRTLGVLVEPSVALTPVCGVYLLFIDDELAYVGRSKSVRTRLADHRADGRQFDRYEVIACDEAASVWLEKELIRTLRPQQNLLRYARHTEAATRQLGALSGG